MPIFSKRDKKIEKNHFKFFLIKKIGSLFSIKKTGIEILEKERDELKEKKMEIHKKIVNFERAKNREKSRLDRREKKIQRKIEFIKSGGTKVSVKFFEKIDSFLKKKFIFYQNWHLNPVAPKIHLTTFGVFLVAMVSIVTISIQSIPFPSIASNTQTEDKTSLVAVINPDSVKNSNNQTTSSEQSLLTILKENISVEFSDQASKKASSKVITVDSVGSEKSVEFIVMQPSETENPVKEEQRKETSQQSIVNTIYADDITVVKDAKPAETNIEAIAENVDKPVDTPEQVNMKVNDSLKINYQVKKEQTLTYIKETLIIEDKASLNNNPDYSISFKMNLNGLKAVQNDHGDFSLVDDVSNEQIMTIMPPVIEDANKLSGDVTLNINGGTATYQIDKNFVDNAAYPLFLDPTVVIDNSTTTNPNSFSKDRTLFEATNGSMINVYSDGSALNYKISSDHGNSWSASVKIIDTSIADDNGFSGWITAANKIHLVYSNNNTNSYIFYRQLTFNTDTNTVTSTGTEYTVESAGTSQAFPSVTQEPTGVIYVAYRFFDGTDYSIRVKASTASDGSTWGSSTIISSLTTNLNLYPAFTLWNDNPAVVYNFANASIKWNYYSESAWQLAGWANETITDEVDADTRLEFSIGQETSDHYLHLTWRGSGTNGIKYKKNSNGASAWGSSSTDITSVHNDRMPSIGLGLNDAIYLYYSEYVGADSYNIKYVEKIGDNDFNSAVVVTTDNGNNLNSGAGLKSAISVNVYSPVIFVSGVTSPYNLNYAPTVKVWSASADGNWETDENWAPSGAPVAGDNVVFDSSSNYNCTVTTYTGEAGGMGITDGIGAIYVGNGYTGEINFQAKPSQNIDPYKINITGDFVINGGTVTTDGDVTAVHNGITDGQGNEFVARNMIIGVDGEINANGLGYAPGQGPGYTSRSIGSSYGGQGYMASEIVAYGDYSDPVSLGSGGWGGNYAYTPGGGAIVINVINTLDIRGAISASGTSGGKGWCGSSGGSINLTAFSISNTGSGGNISANGGNGGSYGGRNGSGSGGRIKLEATTLNYSGEISAAGGSNSAIAGSAGTIYKKTTGQTYGDLIIANGSNAPNSIKQYAAYLKNSTDTGSYQFDSITFSNYGRLAVAPDQTLALDSGSVIGDKNSGIVNTGTVVTPAQWTLGHWFSDKNGTITDLSSKNLTISSNGYLTHYPNTDAEIYKLNWSLNNLTIEEGGEINVNSVGFSAQNGPGKSTSTAVGASHGGQGYGASITTVYGDYSNPTSLGSGGRSFAGGGTVIFNIANILDISGIISAEGQQGDRGSGAGGSINLTASVISGTEGVISAEGKENTNYIVYPGHSSGGRIKLEATTLNYSGDISAGGGGASSKYAAAGTIYKKTTDQTYGDLIIDNGSNGVTTSFTPINLPQSFDGITISNHGQLLVNVNLDPTQNSLLMADGLSIDSTSEIKLTSDTDEDPVDGSWPKITVGGDASVLGKIDADGLGFANNTGTGAGYVTATYGSGAGYGGNGGSSADGATGGITYGDTNDNNYLGSGGGGATGGTGGGMAQMVVGGNLDLGDTGSISANGVAGGASGGGGSGGSVQLTVGAVVGSAGSSITANGGNGGTNAGGGGGGRIAIYTSADTFLGSVTTSGGTSGSGAVAGDDGTVFIQHSPSSLTMNAPNDTATDQVQKTAFRFNSTDLDDDWIQYKVQLATNNEFTENLSTFDQTVSQNPTDGDRTAVFSNQDKATGGIAGNEGYTSGREAVLTLETDLTQNTTYYWRFYACDPEGTGFFDGTQHWSTVSATRSFTTSAIDHLSFSTPQQESVVTYCSAVMTVDLRDSLENDIYLTSDDGSKTLDLNSTSDSGGFYSDPDCLNVLTDDQLAIDVGSNSASFFYKDTTPSAINSSWNITVSEVPDEGWTDATQQIEVRPGDFGSFDVSGAPESIIAGNEFVSPANDIVVTVKDIFGNVKTDWTGQIWFYASDSQAVINYDDNNKYTFTSGEGLDNGTHTFSGSGFIFKTKGNQSLVIHNSEGGQYDEVLSIVVLPSSLDHFGLNNYPRAAVNKFAMSSFSWDTPGYSSAPYNPEVTAYDQYNNVVDSFTGPVWFELYKSSDTAGNPLDSSVNYAIEYDHTEHYTFTSGDELDNGVHTFAGSGFTVVTAANDLKLRVVTSSAGGKYTEFTIKVKPQSIDHFTISTSPTLSRDGVDWDKEVDTTFVEDVIVTAYDQFGNVKTDYAYDENTKAGMIYFYSSDDNAVLPYTKESNVDSSNSFQFPVEALGVYTFNTSNTTNDYFKFQSGGYQTLSVSESIDPESTYYLDATSNKYDPRFEETNPLKIAAAIGSLPVNTATPEHIFVATHQPGSTHAASDHGNNNNDLIEAVPGHQQVTLTWTNPFDIPSDASLNSQAYIYRCESDCEIDNNFFKIDTDPAAVTVTPSSQSEYTDTGLTNNVTYYYKISYAYEREDDSYIESAKSITINATPADIAPRDVVATQLDITDVDNPGKIKIDYKLRWDSTVSLAYYNPASNTWHDASASAMSGDVGDGITGVDSLISHTAYLDPNVDFDGQYLNETFKTRVKVTVGASSTYSDSSVFTLDSKNPASAQLVVDAGNLQTANLTLGATDDNALLMKVSTNADFAEAEWQSISEQINNFDINGKSNVYVVYRDYYNNTTILSYEISDSPSNVSIKDGSNIASSNYRLFIIWDDVTPTPDHYNIQRSIDGETYTAFDTTSKNAAIDINLDANITYYYKVQSEDANGNLSPFSNPVYSSPGLAPDVTAPPDIELFGWKQDQGVRAKISWHTDQSSDSFVAYSTEELADGATLTTKSGNAEKVKVVGQPDLALDHEIMLYNLDPSEEYYFKVLSKNEIQITGYSDVFGFSTPERILLLVSGLQITDITNTSAFVSWTTSKLSTTVLEYGSTDEYGFTINDPTQNTEHKFQLYDLIAGDYHLRVKATDVDGNITISDDYTFEVPALPAVSDVLVADIGETTAKISWTTNVSTNSNVDIESEEQSGSQGNGDFTTTHSITLVGLTAKTTYSFKTRSIDIFGNVTLSDKYNFTTTADTQKPEIINPRSEVYSTGSGDNIKFQLIVSWETNEAATSRVDFGQGVGNNYDSVSKENLSLDMTHVVIINDLKANSVYHFRVTSGDRSGNIGVSEDYTITTPPKEKNIYTIIINAIVDPLNNILQGVAAKLWGK